MKSVGIRAMGADDVAEVTTLARASLPEAWDAAGFAAELDKKTSVALVALDGSRVVALGIGSRIDDDVEILSIAVASDARRGGLGRAMLRALLRDVARAHLEVRASNAAAIALYASAGFVEIDRRAGYYRDGEDAVVMERRGKAP